MAEVKSSRPACKRSGFPEAVIIINPEYTINRKATPPPTPIAHLSTKFKKLYLPSVPITGIHPMAVLIFVLVAGSHQYSLVLPTEGIQAEVAPLHEFLDVIVGQYESSGTLPGRHELLAFVLHLPHRHTHSNVSAPCAREALAVNKAADVKNKARIAEKIIFFFTLSF